MKFSCVYPLYYKSKISEVIRSFKSINNQSLKASEILIIFDGPVSKEIFSFFIKKKNQNKKIRIINFKKNVGLGKLLSKVVKLAKYEIIIRADSDDINKKERFKYLINYLKKNSSIHVVSSYVKEIHKNRELVKKLPLNHDEIVKIINFKNPINHPAVAFRKKAVLNCGGYEDVPYFEDYFLWTKMINKNYKFHNLNKTLVISKVDDKFYSRRSGIQYLGHYLFFLNKIRSKKYINLFDYFINFSLRTFIYILPNLFVISFYNYFNNRK